MQFPDLVPDDWFRNKKESSIWIRCFRIFCVPQEIISPPIIINLSDLVLVALHGQVPYLDSSLTRIEYNTEAQPRFDTSQLQLRYTLEGAYIVLITPFKIDGQEGNEPVVKKRLQEVSGLLLALNGKNMAFEMIFDNIMTLNNNSISVFSTVTENPLFFSPPDVSEEQINLLSDVDEAINLLRKEQKNRVNLSLRWFESAMRESGTDSFLSYWIALETLGMYGTNIRPLNERLAKIYGKTVEEASTCFGVGRIFNLRGLIVHEGKIVPIHQNLQKYMEALYIDIFLEYLQLPSKKCANRVLNEPNFDLTTYLHI